MAPAASLLLGLCLSLPAATGLELRGDNPMKLAKEAVDSFDPFAIASATTMVRLGKTSNAAQEKVWSGDRAKALDFAGLSDGNFKAGAVLSSGVGKKKLHTEGVVGYAGAEAKGVPPTGWRVGWAEAVPEKWQATAAQHTADGGVDYARAEGAFSGGHVAASELGKMQAQGP
uniref:Subtilisin n=1 Tax=Alexandrium catenella TaxID=2925 RepID=A0A7S1WX16_ALECA